MSENLREQQESRRQRIHKLALKAEEQTHISETPKDYWQSMNLAMDHLDKNDLKTWLYQLRNSHPRAPLKQLDEQLAKFRALYRHDTLKQMKSQLTDLNKQRINLSIRVGRGKLYYIFYVISQNIEATINAIRITYRTMTDPQLRMKWLKNASYSAIDKVEKFAKWSIRTLRDRE
jgi:hypothetical protein